MYLLLWLWSSQQWNLNYWKPKQSKSVRPKLRNLVTGPLNKTVVSSVSLLDDLPVVSGYQIFIRSDRWMKVHRKENWITSMRSIFILHPIYYAKKADHCAGPSRVLSAHHVDGIIFCFLIFFYPRGNCSACILSPGSIDCTVSVYRGLHILWHIRVEVCRARVKCCTGEINCATGGRCSGWRQIFFGFRRFLKDPSVDQSKDLFGNCNWILDRVWL